MRGNFENAVSPVVGVMLMLVVVIIIAAVVSAFAGGAVSGQKKTPQATITAKYSISTGLEMTHAGGDGLATADTVFVVRDNSLFGPNLEQKTAQVLNKTRIADGDGRFLENVDGTSDITSFVSGDTLFIDARNTSCDVFQPVVSPSDYNYNTMGTTYTGSIPSSWKLCIRNPDNIGKTFSLEVSDKKGNLIARSDVIITA